MLFVVDANVLIDFVEVDASFLTLAVRHLGPVHVPRNVLDEISRLDEEACERLGLQVVDGTVEQLLEAGASQGALSFYDRLCYILARDHGWTCVTNDRRLRRDCEAGEVDVMWGLQMILAALDAGALDADSAWSWGRPWWPTTPGSRMRSCGGSERSCRGGRGRLRCGGADRARGFSRSRGPAMRADLAVQVLLVLLIGWVDRRQQRVIRYLLAENAVLREHLGPRRLRLTDVQRRRLAVEGKALGRRALAEVAGIVTADTILRWYRLLVVKKYDGSSRRSPGRPTKPEDIVALVLRLARENPGWGYTRIRDGLFHLGHEISRSTVKRILQEHGIEPAPERRRTTSWHAFLKAHWGSIAAADFLTVEVLTLGGLVRYHVLVVMDLMTRKVEIAGISPEPTGPWMVQVARQLTDCEDGFLLGKRFIVLDRDRLYSAAFRRTLEGSGVKVLRLPARSPNLNAFVERFVLSIKQECLGRLIPLGEAHLRWVVGEYVRHFNAERPHQGLGGALAEGGSRAEVFEGEVRCRERVGGLLKYHYREAA